LAQSAIRDRGHGFRQEGVPDGAAKIAAMDSVRKGFLTAPTKQKRQTGGSLPHNSSVYTLNELLLDSPI